MRRLFLCVLTGLTVAACSERPKQVSVTVYYTTDVHGHIFNHDVKRNRKTPYSLAKVSEFMRQARTQDTSHIVFLDNGDFLQGQPQNYYFNFIETAAENLVAGVMNYLQNDAASVGNHDIEAGHPVYDKVKRELNFPWLSANTIHLKTGEPYFQPYTVIHRGGVKIAVLGMTTPGIPKWLPTHLWKDLEFKDMIETARKWVPEIQKKEQPDLLIGLFHSGSDHTYAGEDESLPCNENAGLLVARRVDGFDAVILGHDHQQLNTIILNDYGHPVCVIDAGSRAQLLGKIHVRMTLRKGEYRKKITAELLDMRKVPEDTAFIRRFAPEAEEVRAYINEHVGEFRSSLSGQEGIMGPSGFTDLVNAAQQAATGADISFTSVLQTDASIKAGPATIRDMFNLYGFENGLYVIHLQGKEIIRYLEYASTLQFNTMRSAGDHLMNLKADTIRNDSSAPTVRYRLANDFFNFSAAAGIRYTVNVSKEAGNRITVRSLANGRPFCPDSVYSVAINSYRAQGGGGHMTRGIGLSKEEIEKRIVRVLPYDVRYYITEFIREKKVVDPQPAKNWDILPGNWYRKGKSRDHELLFGKPQR